MDGSRYYKRSICSHYKENRKSHTKNSELSEIIYKIILTLSNYHIIIGDTLEADDVSYCLCRDLNDCLCVSEDSDWTYNLTANSNIQLIQKKSLITRDNFEALYGFTVDKVGFFLFLKGDSKDGVRKPFRIKGSLVTNVLKYSGIEEYVRVHKLDLSTVRKYLALILPVISQPYKTIKGEINENTKKYINQYSLDFFRPLLIRERVLV